MAELLSEDEVDAQLPDEWARADDEIVGTYEFDEYMPGVAFAQSVAEIAEHQVHHPTIVIGYERVEIRLTSHEEGGITETDVEMAEIIDQEY